MNGWRVDRPGDEETLEDDQQADGDDARRPAGPVWEPADVASDQDDQVSDGEREEIAALNSQIEFLNRALDDIEHKNSELQRKLLQFLSEAGSVASSADESPEPKEEAK